MKERKKSANIRYMPLSDVARVKYDTQENWGDMKLQYCWKHRWRHDTVKLEDDIRRRRTLYHGICNINASSAVIIHVVESYVRAPDETASDGLRGRIERGRPGELLGEQNVREESDNLSSSRAQISAMYREVIATTGD